MCGMEIARARTVSRAHYARVRRRKIEKSFEGEGKTLPPSPIPYDAASWDGPRVAELQEGPTLTVSSVMGPLKPLVGPTLPFG